MQHRRASSLAISLLDFVIVVVDEYRRAVAAERRYESQRGAGRRIFDEFYSFGPAPMALGHGPSAARFYEAMKSRPDAHLEQKGLRRVARLTTTPSATASGGD